MSVDHDDDDRGSITGWLEGLKAGQPEAADAIWQHYYQRVVTLARHRLRAGPHQAVEDGEDVALSAMRGLCAGAAEGRFPWLRDRVDLWQLLAAITVKKVLARQRWYDRQKRGGGRVVNGRDPGQCDAVNPDHDQTARNPRCLDNDSDPNPLARAVSHEPTPESAAIIAEEVQELLDALPDPALRQIAEWRMDGLRNSNKNAANLGVS